MPSLSILKCPGLHTSSNEFASIPEGALVRADNVVIRSKDVLEPRRGHYHLSGTLPARPREVFFYKGKPIVYTEDGFLSRYDSDSAVVQYASEEFPPDESLLRMKGVEAQGNFYFTTGQGVRRLDRVSGEAQFAGGPKSADLYGVLSSVLESSGFLASGQRVAYRVVFGAKDASGTLHLGAPSGRGFATGSGSGASNVNVRAIVPSWVSAGTILRVYRTAQSPSSSDPGDEMGLVYETTVTAAMVTAREFTFKDTTPDAFLGAPLYTNPNVGEGILQANEPPPLAHDLAWWGGRMWFGNTTQLPRLYLDVVGVGVGAGRATGIREGDVLTVHGRTYQAYDAQYEAGGTGRFAVVPSGASPADRIAGTARNLVEAINRDPASSVRAYYLSGPNDVPGKLVLEGVGVGMPLFSATADSATRNASSLTRSGSTVTVKMSADPGLAAGDTFMLSASAASSSFPTGSKTCTSYSRIYSGGAWWFEATYTESGAATSITTGGYTVKRTSPAAGAAWNPELPASGTGVQSSDDRAPHRLYYSKIQQPEATPLLNYLDVGTRGKAILRLLPLRDKLYVFKEEGIYIVSGDAPFRVDLLDDTARLLAPDSAVTVSNQIYALTNQGVVAVSESGVAIVSRAIEPELVRLFGSQLATIRREAFGVAHESERMYALFLPGQAYVYNTLLGVWTRWAVSRSCGRVHPETDVLHLGSTTAASLMKERRNFLNDDYVDDTLSRSVLSADSASRTLVLNSVEGIAAGDVLVEQTSGTGFHGAIVESVEPGSNSLVVDLTTLLPISSPTPAIVAKAVACDVVWATQTAGDPNASKQFPEANLHLRTAAIKNLTLNFTSDLAPETGTVLVQDKEWVTATPYAWGQLIFPEHRRILVPMDQQRASYLRVGLSSREALGFWQLNGLSLKFDTVSTATFR